MAKSGEEKFKITLEYLYQDGWGGLQGLYLDLALSNMFARDKALLSAANRNPIFWNTVIYGWRAGYMSSLFRAYDRSGRHNIVKLLDIVEANLDIFSKESLVRRKMEADSDDDADRWLPGYLKNVHVPDKDDIKRFRKNTKKHIERYNANYLPIRNKVLFHRVMESEIEVKKLYSNTNIQELRNLFIFLAKLYQALQGLYLNGRRPVMKPIPFSVDRIIEGRLPAPHRGMLHVQSVADLKKALVAFERGAQLDDRIRLSAK